MQHPSRDHHIGRGERAASGWCLHEIGPHMRRVKLALVDGYASRLDSAPGMVVTQVN